jgi:hypothetical protein
MTVDGIEIGNCLYGVDVSINDYSRMDRDTFGGVTAIVRNFSDVVSFPVEIATENVQQVKDLLASKRAVEATYIGFSGLAITKVVGYLNQFSITIDNWKTSTLSLEVEGVARS